jgi:hypothetical protein
VRKDSFLRFTARLKSCPDTCMVDGCGGAVVWWMDAVARCGRMWGAPVESRRTSRIGKSGQRVDGKT